MAGAFPLALHDDVAAAAAVVPGPGRRLGAFSVLVEGHRVTVPERIYAAEPADREVEQLPLVAHQLLATVEPWVTPFVVRLVGEYVVEIMDTIELRLDSLAVPGVPGPGGLPGLPAADGDTGSQSIGLSTCRAPRHP